MTVDVAPAGGGSDALSHRQMRLLGRALPRRLRFTREGKLLVFLSLGIGFAAVNSGNNLLYLIFGMLLSFIMVSGILSELNLRGIVATRESLPHLFVGGPALVAVRLKNTKRRFASLSIEATELFAQDWVDAGTEQRRGYVLHLKPGGEATVYMRIVAGHRGVMPSAGIRVATRFPFGFFEKSRIFAAPTRYIVFPGLRGQASGEVRPRAHGLDEQATGVGAGDEFHGLRDMRAGDDARDIAWKVSARRDKMVVREYERPATRKLVLLVHNAVPPGEEARAHFEEAVDRVARLATSYSEAGYAVGLATAEGATPPETGRAALVRLYGALARLPVREVPRDLIGRLPPLPKAAPGRSALVERVAVLTVEQQAAGLSLPSDRRVLVGTAAGAGRFRRDAEGAGGEGATA